VVLALALLDRMFLRLAPLALAAMCLACSGSSPAVAADPPSEAAGDEAEPTPAEPSSEPTPDPAMTTMQPTSSPTFVDGHALTPSADLLEWLEAGKGKQLRLPVVIRFKDDMRMNWGAITIGTALGDAAEGDIHLKLDDTKMGVGLLDRLAGEVPEGDAGCVRWVEATWGPAMEGGPDLSRFEPPGPKRHPIAVTAISEGVPSDAKAQVAK